MHLINTHRSFFQFRGTINFLVHPQQVAFTYQTSFIHHHHTFPLFLFNLCYFSIAFVPKTALSISLQVLHYYRPHPKDGGRYCFQFVSPHLDGGGGETPSNQWGIPPSFLMGAGTPIPPNGGTPILPNVGEVPPSSLTPWYPPVRTGWGTPTIETGWRYLPPSGLDGGNPQPPLALDGGTPCQNWMGYPPTPQSGDKAAKRALATRRAVCLLRSRRRTFLFYI